MAKKKTSKKPKRSFKNLKEYKSSTSRLKDKRLVKETLAECLMENDIEAFRDVLIAHLRATNKSKLAKETGIGRQTIYDLMEADEFNPELKTVGRILESI